MQTVLKWLPFFAIDIEDWPSLASYVARIETRPSVMAAIEAEANAGQG
jgi:glutathione S-transferase